MALKWSRIQLISGLMILFFVAQHITGNLMARFLSDIDTTFHWPASVMNGAPFVFYFFTYYFIGVTAMFVHLACFARLALLRRKQNQVAIRVFWAFSISGAPIALLINLMLMGAFFYISLPDKWVGYLQGFLPNYVPN